MPPFVGVLKNKLLHPATAFFLFALSSCFSSSANACSFTRRDFYTYLRAFFTYIRNCQTSYLFLNMIALDKDSQARTAAADDAKRNRTNRRHTNSTATTATKSTRRQRKTLKTRQKSTVWSRLTIWVTLWLTGIVRRCENIFTTIQQLTDSVEKNVLFIRLTSL